MITVEYNVDIVGDHEAPLEELLEIIERKQFENPYDALQFLNTCTLCLNKQEIIRNLNRIYKMDWNNVDNEPLLLNTKRFKPFNDFIHTK